MKQTIPCLLLLCIAFPAAAQPPLPPQPPMPTFAEFDADGDGAVTEQEFVDARNKRIAARAGEGRPMRGLAQVEEFKDIDSNGDGRLSREEFAAYQNRHRPPRPGGYPR
ncbi:EF-hand domain-containing protein [Sulfurivermis fontis]|jgi:hypothetical protein|uniref:EF-hand domain-containing protein n=1 Tax=Sulfurivermis fontis TaxID=1972068 RepID=UPI000FD8C889|nr:EF-hand domain-containing protein [Sulfurivermis fontis]